MARVYRVAPSPPWLDSPVRSRSETRGGARGAPADVRPAAAPAVRRSGRRWRLRGRRRLRARPERAMRERDEPPVEADPAGVPPRDDEEQAEDDQRRIGPQRTRQHE